MLADRASRGMAKPRSGSSVRPRSSFEPVPRSLRPASGHPGLVPALAPGSQRPADSSRQAGPPAHLTLESTRHVDGAANIDLAVGADGRLAAFIDHNNRIRVWDLAGDRELSFRGPRLLLGYHSLSFLPDDRSLVYVSDRGVAEVWDAADDRRIGSLGQDRAFWGFQMSLSRDGRWLAGEARPAAVSI